MKGSAKFFVLFPAKISYAGGQGADSKVQKIPVRHAVPIHRDQHLSIARVGYEETLNHPSDRPGGSSG